MYIPHEHRRAPLLLMVFMAVATIAAPANTPVVTPGSPTQIPSTSVASNQPTSIQPGTYTGTLVFEDQNGTKWDGPAELEVKKDRKFTLTDKWKNKHEGELFTVINMAQIPGGHMKFAGDRKFSIKWTQDQKEPSRVKILSRSVECIKFRFCSNQVSAQECRTTLK